MQRFKYLLPICLLAACQNSHPHTAATTTADTAATPASQTSAPAQIPDTEPESFHLAQTATGDLDKDGLADSVAINIDTLQTEWPVKISVYFATHNGYRLVAETQKALAPLRPGGNEYGNEMGDVRIDKGVLHLSEQLLRGHDDYVYRYQDGHFDLIGYSSGFVDHGQVHTIDYNLMTWRLVYEITEQESDDIFKKQNSILKLSSRPQLESFEAGSIPVRSGDMEFYL